MTEEEFNAHRARVEALDNYDRRFIKVNALVDEMGNLVDKRPHDCRHKLAYTMKRWEFELISEFILDHFDRKAQENGND